MDWLDSIGSFLGENSSWLKPVGNAVLGAVGANQQNNNRTNMLDATRAAIQNQYDREQAQAQADAEYEAAYGNWAAGQRARSSAAAAANANAASAAAAQTKKNAMAARKKGDKVQTKAMRQSLGYLKPFRDSALTLLPQMQASYTQGNSALQGLASKLLTPDSIEQSFTPQLAVNQHIPLSKLLGGA